MGWSYVGGRIEKGEKAWEAALREVHEETGITEVRLYSANQFEQYWRRMSILLSYS
ncbi:NUDIX domain-containing protein [Paenibacillus sp. LX16]|uniref:NUDIX domain-containing protein n=1 Tax=Paenibacillus sp. LX16 TaxID=1740264 RepID=UPI002E2B581B|nr:NUDIX domain-containing protein [Paenibacillus sp. LX16]